ncbi:YfdX family protein [Jiella mangrovi]|uniref:YfdX family protein n=1 Tax=Jiella mangrovi TaxID=2821407 RepID=A0ABS4BIP4_9HYPH|nr:YfdX family protein [Jiella mangrovi]MBP0616637.1 YfdX family protein [Jiella mangrovi]
MSRNAILAITLASATALASASYAASSDASTAANANGQAQTNQMTSKVDKTAERDFTKLSKKGYSAFRDLRLARLAIFDGKTKEASKLLDEAKTAMQAASKDDTQFMKAEADITPPKGAAGAASKTAMNTQGQSAGTSDDQMSTASTTGDNSDAQNPSNKPIAWLPIDGQMTVAEDFSASPEKAAAVKKANESLKKGNRKEALDTLKLAGISVEYTMVIAPLDKTQAQIKQASEDVADGKYYEANLALKKAEDAVRIDAVDVVGTPEKAAAKSSDAASTKASASASESKAMKSTNSTN